MKKYIKYILIIIIITGFFSSAFKLNAQTPPTTDQRGTCTYTAGSPDINMTQADCVSGGGSWSTAYVLLAPLPCDPTNTPGCDSITRTLKTFDPSSASGDKISGYLNIMIKIFIGLCAVLAVVMIVIGGIEYMTSELVSSKEAGKERIRGAIFGLLLALGAWTLLNQINPDILNTDLNSLQGVTVDVTLGSLSNETYVPAQQNALQALGIKDCTGSGGKGSVATIANEFIGKTKYSQTSRNTISGNTISLDCTSFVDQVYNCAGLAMPQITGANIASAPTLTNAKPVDGKTFDFSTLNPGDLVGWGTNSDGHMAIYLGNGKIIDTNKSGNTQILLLSTYTDKIKFVMWSKPK